MKKILLFAFACFSYVGVHAQVILNVEEPADLAGNLVFTFPEFGGGWGVPDMNLAANSVRAIAVFGATDSLGCVALTNGAAINGKIAVIYRGSCEFGAKALNAQNAGAKAVIIINNVAGAPIAMGAGAVGAQVTIPAAMISQQDGERLRAAIKAGTVEIFFGSKRGVFARDLGVQKDDVLLTPQTARPSAITTNAADFTFTPGALVYNYGKNAQTGVSLKAEVLKGGAVVYTQTSAPADYAVDGTLFVSLPTVALNSYSNGQYTVKYTVVSSAGADDFPADNVYESNMYVNDDILSLASIDLVKNVPISATGYRPGTFQGSFSACITFTDKNLSRLKAEGAYFQAYANTGEELTDQFFSLELYEWNDPIEDINALAFNDINLVGTGDYVFEAHTPGESVYTPFNFGVVLKDNQKYMLCANTSSDAVYIGYETGLDYDENVTTSNFPVSPIKNGDTYDGIGFGTNAVPALALKVSGANGITSVVKNSDVIPFPMPAQNFVNLPLKNIPTGQVNVRVIDVTGKEVLASQINADGTSALKVNTTSLPNGIYNFILSFADNSAQAVKVQINK